MTFSLKVIAPAYLLDRTRVQYITQKDENTNNYVTDFSWQSLAQNEYSIVWIDTT